MGLRTGLFCNAWMPEWNLTEGGERCKTLGLHPCLRPRILGDAFLTRTPAASWHSTPQCGFTWPKNRPSLPPGQVAATPSTVSTVEIVRISGLGQLLDAEETGNGYAAPLARRHHAR